MTDVGALSPAMSMRFFRSPPHVPVSLERFPDGRVFWLNQRALQSEPGSVEGESKWESRREHFLRTCGYGIAEVGCAEEATGIADRYGGRGIGANGGSGRGAFVNGYHVKGIGRTPLVGRETEAGHASGGAYLEECVRETILSELVQAEFPHGAVPTLALIDTGVRQVWKQFRPAKIERRCLLVRPCFLRPAHFERAAGFLAEDVKDGHRDRLRVEHMFDTAREVFGRDTFLSIYDRFWLTWAEQLAYAFVHRLPHGGDNTSNVAFDARLLDFGATVSVPTWACVSLALGIPPLGRSLEAMVHAIRMHALSLGRYIDPAEATLERITGIATIAAERYRLVVQREMLRVAGLTRHQAELLLASDRRADLVSILGRVLNHFRREQFAIFDGTPDPRIPWDFGRLWSQSPPVYLRRLREFLLNSIEVFGDTRQVDRLVRGFGGRCVMRTWTRSELYRERIKKRLFGLLETDMAGDALNQNSLDEVISATVCRNRRDSKVEPDGAIPIGFARNCYVGYALFRCLDTTREFAVREWGVVSGDKERHDEAARELDGEAQRLYIADITTGGILFASPAVAEFSGSVSLL